MNLSQSCKSIEEYFNFLDEYDIRLKGTRIGIETIIFDYIECGNSAEKIAQTYPSLNLEKVYATILFYLQNREKVTEYMKKWQEHGYLMRENQRLNSPLAFDKLNNLRNEIKLRHS